MTAYGHSLKENNYTSRAVVHESFYTLISSRVRQVNTGFMFPDEFEKLWHNQRKANVITLGGLFFKYSKLKDNAISTGKINVENNQIYDVFDEGVWQNPYEVKDVFMLAPSINNYKGLNFQVKLPRNIFLSNQPNEVRQIEVDLGDGLGYRTLKYNEDLNVNYTEEGDYVWKFKLILTDGKTLYSHSLVSIESGLDEFPSTSVTATKDYYGKYGKATIYVKDNESNGIGITKPLIVAEGFDAGTILNPEQEGGNVDIKNFIETVDDGSFQLLNKFNSYDIIYVDWDDGVDFIQRNAYAFEEAIRWVNQQKELNSSNEPNVVLGQSMGGLVARYALASIEDDGDFNHETNMYISHDSPHLGANTPIGLQHLFRHTKSMYQEAPIPYLLGEVIIPLSYSIGNIFEDVVNEYGGNVSVGSFVTPSQAFGLSDFPASRQMLYNWVNTNYGINNDVHDAWQQELSEKGYPEGYNDQPIRNIAIANCSECGSGFKDNVLMSYSKTAADKTVLNSIFGLTDILIGNTALLGTWQGLVLTGLGAIPGSSKYDIQFYAYSMKNLNEDKQIYYGRITYKKKILWFIPISVNFTKEEKFQPNLILPYDNYAGGSFNILNNIGGVLDALPTLENNGTFGSFSFIPTPSSLDIGSGNVNLNNFDYRNSYIGELPPNAPKDSPFENFVTHFDFSNPSNNNSEHISFNLINGNWLANELDEDPEFSNCSYLCEGGINGNSLVCGTSNFTINGDTSFVNWSIEPSSAATISVNPNDSGEITLTRSTNFNGNAVLKANISTPKCGSGEIIKNLTFGSPTTNQSVNVSGPSNLNPGQTGTYSFSTASFNNASSFDWLFFSNVYQNAEQNFELNIVSDGAFTVKPDFDVPGGYYTVQAMAENNCGFYPISKTIYVEEGDGTPVLYPRYSNLYTIYPNPSTSFFNISLFDENSKPVNSKSISGELLDLNGLFVKSIDINDNGQTTVNVTALEKGIYILRINYDSKTEAHQVIVE